MHPIILCKTIGEEKLIQKALSLTDKAVVEKIRRVEVVPVEFFELQGHEGAVGMCTIKNNGLYRRTKSRIKPFIKIYITGIEFFENPPKFHPLYFLISGEDSVALFNSTLYHEIGHAVFAFNSLPFSKKINLQEHNEKAEAFATEYADKYAPIERYRDVPASEIEAMFA